MKEIIVTENEAGQRVDKLLVRVLCQCTKSFIYKQMRKKNIVLNDKKMSGNEILRNKDSIKIYFSDETYEKFTARAVEDDLHLPEEFKVIYEDEDVVLMNKWAGVLSQKADKEDASMNEYLLTYLKCKRPDIDYLTFKPSVVNRLDRNTSGILIGSASLKGARVMSDALKHRKVKKEYLAVVKGCVKEDIYIKGYLRKDEITNKVEIISDVTTAVDPSFSPIETDIKVLKATENYSVLLVHLITGKTHQIRAHLSSVGHPILGDTKYGGVRLNNHRGQLLHSYRLTFPEDFALEKLANQCFTLKAPEYFDEYIGEDIYGNLEIQRP